MDADDASYADMRRPLTDPDADPLALDENTVERLLTGDLPPSQVPPSYAQVAALLAATTAEPTPEELAGQSKVLAELRAVTRPRRAGAHTRRVARPPRRRWAGLAAVVLVGAVVTGGAAAAATGHLPAPVRDAARSILAPLGGDAPPAAPGALAGPAVTGGPAPTGATTGPQGSQSTGTTSRGPASSAAGPAAGPDLEGLCRAYLAGQGGEQGKKLGAPALQALARAAGDEDKIAGHCVELLPGGAKPKDDEDEPGDQGQGQGQEQGGPPASTGPGTQGERTPGARSAR